MQLEKLLRGLPEGKLKARCHLLRKIGFSVEEIGKGNATDLKLLGGNGDVHGFRDDIVAHISAGMPQGSR